MNKAMVIAADWAFIAGLMNAGRANVFVNSQGKLFLTFFLNRSVGLKLEPWMRALRGLDGMARLKPEFGRGKVSTRIRVRFCGREAIEVLNKASDWVFDPRLKRGMELAQDWWNTVQSRGRKLPTEAREKRDALIAQFKGLRRA